MATVQEIKSGLLNQQDQLVPESATVDASGTITEKPTSFLDTINIKGSESEDLDKRFFTGVANDPAGLRTDIENGIGYRTFNTYYDEFLEQNRRFNPKFIAPSKQQFNEASSRGEIEGLEANVTADDSRLIPFTEGMTYADKIKAMAQNRAKTLETNESITSLPVNRLLNQSTQPFLDKDDPVRLPQMTDRTYTDVEGNVQKLPDRPVFGQPGEEGKVVINDENPSLLFKKFLDNKTNLSEYQKAMLIKAQGTGGFSNEDESLEAYRTMNYAKDVLRMGGNATLFLAETAVNTLGDLLRISDGEKTPEWLKNKLIIPETHLDYASETFAKRADVDVDVAERILDWSPDWVAPIKREFVAGLPVAGVLSVGKFGSVLLRNAGFKSYVKKEFGGGKTNITFEEAFKKGMKEGQSYDSMLTGYASEGFNTPFLNSWKKSATIDSINSVSSMKNWARKVDTSDVDSMISQQKETVKLYHDRKNMNPKFFDKWKKESDALQDLESRREKMFLTARIPVKFLNAVKTEGFPAIGVGLSKHTHQQYFEDQNETMFEFGGVAVGLYGEKLVFGRTGSIRNLFKSMTTTDISTGNKMIAESFVANLYTKSPSLAKVFEDGLQTTLDLERRLLKLNDVNGKPIITSPDLISKTLENINVLNILKQTSSSANNKIKAGDAQSFSEKFVNLQTKLIDQVALNDELAGAINKLSVLETSPNISPEDLSFIKGLRGYIGDSRTSLQKEIEDFYTNINDSEALLLLKASGAAIGEKRLDMTEELLVTLNLTRKQMDLALGKSAQQMADETNQRLVTFDTAVTDLANSATNVKKKTSEEIANITSMSFDNIKTSKYSKVSHGFTTLREKYKDAHMDATPVLDSLLKNIGVPDNVNVSKASQRIGGVKLSSLQQSDVGQLLNDSAETFLGSRPDLNDLVMDIKIEYPNATSLEIWSSIKSDMSTQGLDTGFMKLPLNFIEFESVASGFSNLAYKKSGMRASLPLKDLRDTLLKAGEDPVTGFKVGFFDESGGVLINEQAMGEYKLVKEAYQDWAIRYDKGTVGGKFTDARVSKSGDQTLYKQNMNPANWIANELDTALKNNPDNINGTFISDMASVFDGVKIQEGPLLRYEFIAGESGTKQFKSLLKNNLRLMALKSTSGGKLVQDLQNSPDFREKFLLSSDYESGRMLIGTGRDDFMKVIRQMEQATMTTKNGDVIPMFSVAEIQNVFDVSGIEELVRVSKPAKEHVKKAMNDLRLKVDEIRKPNSAGAKELLAETNIASQYINKLKPDDIGKALSQGEVALDELDSVRNLHIRKLKADNVTGKNYDAAVTRYDKLVAKQTMEYIQAGSVKPVMGKTGTPTKNIPTEIDPTAMWKLLGGEETTGASRTIKQIMYRATGGDKLFENLQAISAVMANRVPGSSSGVGMTGIPRGLSVESYISRFYSMAREVVSFKYVATEAILQTMRMKKFNAFEAMIDNPEIAEHVVKIMTTGKPLTETLSTNFLQLMTNAVAKQVVRYESAEGSALNPNAQNVEGDGSGGVFDRYKNRVREGENQGFLIDPVSRQAMKVPREGEIVTPNINAITGFGQTSSQNSPVGPKFDIRKKPEYMGGDVDTEALFDPKPLTGAEKLFGRVVR